LKSYPSETTTAAYPQLMFLSAINHLFLYPHSWNLIGIRASLPQLIVVERQSIKLFNPRALSHPYSTLDYPIISHRVFALTFLVYAACFNWASLLGPNTFDASYSFPWVIRANKTLKSLLIIATNACFDFNGLFGRVLKYL